MSLAQYLERMGLSNPHKPHITHKLHEVHGRGTIALPLVALYSRKVYQMVLETENPETPDTIILWYTDCKTPVHSYGGKVNDRIFYVQTTICPDGDDEGPGKRWYQALLRVEPIEGEWTVTISEDLNSRGQPNSATMPILVETPPDEP